MAEKNWKINDSYPYFMSVEFAEVNNVNWKINDSYPYFMNMEFKAVESSTGQQFISMIIVEKLMRRKGYTGD